MRVIVCGSREWADPEPIRRELLALVPAWAVFLDDIPKQSLPFVIHGDCRGADRLAGQIAGENGFEVVAVPAEWDRYGKSAGPVRNARMLKEFGRIDLVLAFHEDLPRSRGTKDMVQRAIRAGVPVKIVPKPISTENSARLGRTLQP